MCLNIAGALRDNATLRSFTDSNGKPMPVEDVETALLAKLADGWRVYPMGDCDNFDPQTGCKGHPEPEEK